MALLFDRETLKRKLKRRDKERKGEKEGLCEMGANHGLASK